MSPEQLRGEPLDARSDLFSFGVTLYEMVSGQPPFTAANSASLMSAILTEDPHPLARYARDTPPELERIVSKAMRKDRDSRYQTAKDLLIDVRTLLDDVRTGAARARSASSTGTSAANYHRQRCGSGSLDRSGKCRNGRCRSADAPLATNAIDRDCAPGICRRRCLVLPSPHQCRLGDGASAAYRGPGAIAGFLSGLRPGASGAKVSARPIRRSRG